MIQGHVQQGGGATAPPPRENVLWPYSPTPGGKNPAYSPVMIALTNLISTM
jgi:hypothetical protein